MGEPPLLDRGLAVKRELWEWEEQVATAKKAKEHRDRTREEQKERERQRLEQRERELKDAEEHKASIKRLREALEEELGPDSDGESDERRKREKPGRGEDRGAEGARSRAR